MAENIEQLYENLKDNDFFDFENQEQFKSFLETNPEADKTMSELFGVENASSLLKKKEDVSISSSPSVGVENQAVVESPTMGTAQASGNITTPSPVKGFQPKPNPVKNSPEYLFVSSQLAEANRVMDKNLGYSLDILNKLKDTPQFKTIKAQGGLDQDYLALQESIKRASEKTPYLLKDKKANALFTEMGINTPQQKSVVVKQEPKFNFNKQVLQEPVKNKRDKVFENFVYNSKLPERTAMEIQNDEQQLDLELEKDAQRIVSSGNWNAKDVDEFDDKGFLFKNDDGIVELNPLYTGKKVEGYVNSAVDIPKELKDVAAKRLARLVNQKLEDKFTLEGATKKLEEKLAKEGKTLEEVQRAPVLAIDAVKQITTASDKTIKDFDNSSIQTIDTELKNIKVKNEQTIAPLLKNIQDKIANRAYTSKEEYEQEYGQYVTAVSEANKQLESTRASLIQGYKDKRQGLLENVLKQRKKDLDLVYQKYGITEKDGKMVFDDYQQKFEEAANEFYTEREKQRYDAQSWDQAIKKNPSLGGLSLAAMAKIGGTLVDRTQAASARVFGNTIEVIDAAIGTENNPLSGALKYLEYVQAKSKGADVSFSGALEKGNGVDILQSIVSGVVDQVPNLSIGIATGVITQNPWIAGGVMWGQDSVDQMGETYKQKFKETGSVDQARDAAVETLKTQTVMFPLYALQFAPFTKGFLATGKGITAKAIAGDVAKLAGTELVPEITTEIIQNYKSDQLASRLKDPETGKDKSFYQYFVDNGGKISLDVLPSVLALSGSAVISERVGAVKQEKAIEKLKSSLGEKGLTQVMADAIDVLGDKSVAIIPEYLYRTGQIDAQEFVTMKKNMDEIIKTYPAVRNIIGNEDKARYYLDLNLQKKNLETAMNDPKNEAVKELFQKRIDNISKTLDNLINNKNVEDYTVFTAKDGFKYVTDNQTAANILSGDNNAMNSIISGDLNVESNDSKIQGKIDELKKMKGPQTVTGLEGGTNVNAATVTDQEAVQRVKQDTNRDAVEFDNLVQEVNAAQETLNSKFPGVNIVMHTPDSYNKKMEEVNGRKDSNGNFAYTKNEDGSYSIEIQLNMGTADAKTIAHEVSHAAMLADFGINPKAFDDMKSKLEAIVSDSDNQRLNNFIAKYQESEKSEEYLAELFGIMRTEGTKLNPSVLSRIAQLFNDIVSKLTNGKIIPFKDINDTQQVLDYFNNLADSFKPKTQTDAIQEQTTSQVPVQPETAGSQENAQGQPQAEPQGVTEENQEEIISQSLDNPITTQDVEGRQIEPGYEVFDENKKIDVQSSKTNRGPNFSSKSEIQRDFKLEETDFVDPETIDGKTMMGFLGDLQLAGTVTSPSGVELNGRGGPGFTKWANRNIQINPTTGLYEGRAALWASTFEDSTTKLANRMKKVDGSLIGAQQKTGVLGNVKMLNYFTDELLNAIQSGSASEKQILEILNKPLDSSMTKVALRDYLKLEGNFKSVDEMNAYLNPFVSTEEFKNRFGKDKNVDKVSYEFRSNYFSKIFNISNHQKFNLPSLATGKGYNYDKTVLDYANDSLFNDAGYGDFVGYLTYDPASIKVEKVSEDSEFYNPSYPYVITAEQVGMKFFNSFLDGRAIFYDVKPVSATANQTPFGLREKDQAARAIMGAMPSTDFNAEKIIERQQEFKSRSQFVNSPENLRKADENFGVEDGVEFKSKAQYTPKQLSTTSQEISNKFDENQLENLKGLINEGAVAPQNTTKAYKLFKVKKNFPGELFPLFVGANESVTTGEWIQAKAGELTQTKEGKTMVKSTLGPLAYRPGWHSGEYAIATHIGAKKDFSDKAPTLRADDQVWAEVEVGNDVDWQTEANNRAEKSKDGKVLPRTAHITDQVPLGGNYKYKTNSNMTGSWIISGDMKVNRILTDAEVQEINKESGSNDLPRTKPFDYAAYGFNQDGTVANPKQVLSNQIARAYLNAKETGTNQELVNAVEGGSQIKSKSQLNPDNIGAEYQADIAANKTKEEALSNLFNKGYTYDDIARKLGEVTFTKQDWNNMVAKDARVVAQKISDAKINAQADIISYISTPENAVKPLDDLRSGLLAEGYSNMQILKAFEDMDIAEQSELDEMFGKDYRETVKNALNTEEYSEYFTSLTDDERSMKQPKTEADLRMEAESAGLNFLDGVVYVENVANELENGGLLAAAQLLRDKIANNEIGEDISTAIKTLAKIQSIAGRLLYINRGLFSSSEKVSNMLSQSIVKGGITLSPFQKAKLGNLISAFNDARDRTDKALATFEEDFSDDNFNTYAKAKQDLKTSTAELIKFLDSLKPVYWNDRVTSAGSRALLGVQTVFLSIYANIEQAILSDNAIFKGLRKVADFKGMKTNTVSPTLLLNSYRFSWDKSKQEMLDTFKYGNQADSEFIQKYMDSMANINFFDDIKLSKNLLMSIIGKVGGKKVSEMTDEEFADAFDMALYKTKNGELKLADGKAYTMARSIFWSAFGAIPEFTGRLMAFGGDKLLANATAYRAMLDYFATQDLSKGYFGDFVSDGSQVDKKTLEKLIPLIELTLGSDDYFGQEGLQRVFLSDNLASKNLGKFRGNLNKNIRSKAVQIRKGEGNRFVNELSKQGLQVWDTTVWTLAPFARVPWNVVVAAAQKTDPLSASLFYYSSERKYTKAKNEFNKKYGEVTQFKTKQEKIEFEKARIELFKLKRQMTYDQACISESAFVLALAATAYAAGALIPALLPGEDEEKALKRANLKSGSYNRTLHWEYLQALFSGKDTKNFALKRGGWKPGDNVNQFSNMGLIGYGFGRYGSAAKSYQDLKAENFNNLTPEQITSGLFSLSAGEFLFSGAQQLPMLQGIARIGQFVSDQDWKQFVASTSATALSFTSPGLFSIISKGNAETVQSLKEVNLRTEDLGIVSSVLGEVGVKMIQKLNRNVSFIAKNQFYKAEIGPYGEDLQFRTTTSEPGTMAAYVETIFNPFASRKLSAYDSKRESARYKFAAKINTNMYMLTQAYRQLSGGTMAQKPNMTIEGDLVSVLTKEVPNEFELEANGVYLKYNLPNDMYRAELKKKGDILFNVHGDVYTKSEDVRKYMETFYKGDENKKQAMENIESLFAFYRNTATQAETTWKNDYAQAREKANLLEMKRRGVLNPEQLDKLKQIYGNF